MEAPRIVAPLNATTPHQLLPGAAQQLLLAQLQQRHAEPRQVLRRARRRLRGEELVPEFQDSGAR